jgi:catechol 2,3-dioxygenase-like lactoylglutathione lyase family enzyme
MPTPLAGIGQISIRVHDIERSTAFYRDPLGLDFLFEAGPLAFLMCGDVRLMLTTPRVGRVRPSELDALLPRRRHPRGTGRCPTTSSG